jgi:glutamyl/glutaminyl-tRNA synthetase
MVAVFDSAAMHKAGAIFDVEKSLWMNGQYIRNLSSEAFLELALPWLIQSGLLAEESDTYVNLVSKKTLDKKTIQAILALEQSRIKRLDEVAPAIKPYLDPNLEYESSALVWKKMTPDQVPAVLQDVRVALEHIPDSEWAGERIQADLQKVVADTKRGVGDVFWPTRVALTGKTQSPSPHEVAEVLGKEESLRRLDYAIKLVNK